MTKDERVQRDYAQLPEAKRRRLKYVFFLIWLLTVDSEKIKNLGRKAKHLQGALIRYLKDHIQNPSMCHQNKKLLKALYFGRLFVL